MIPQGCKATIGCYKGINALAFTTVRKLVSIFMFTPCVDPSCLASTLSGIDIVFICVEQPINNTRHNDNASRPRQSSICTLQTSVWHSPPPALPETHQARPATTIGHSSLGTFQELTCLLPPFCWTSMATCSPPFPISIGRASGRERGGQYV